MDGVGAVGPDYSRVSYWFDAMGAATLRARPSLASDIDVDVAVLGAGYTGLWTALYLLRADRRLRVAVVEAEVAGFGASGRNGGWCSAMFATSAAKLVRLYGSEAQLRLRRALEASVDEVGAAAALEGIDCDFRKGGRVMLARDRAQLARARAEIDEARSLGIGQGDLSLLSADDASALVGASEILGALYSPHCASIQPARLARGLADAVERHGGHIYERSPVVEVGPGRLRTPGGQVRASAVLRATEGFTATLPGSHRALIPFYSLMIATEPLDVRLWDEIGLRNGEAFADLRHLVIYGQRTADGRIAFGGRGAPYHFGSRIRPSFDGNRRVHGHVQKTLVQLFPALAGVPITHRWGGPIGIARDWHPSVGFDRASGSGWAGGYVGDGVATSNLAGRTLAALVTGADDDCTSLCWVSHRSRDWEVEPLRWIGVNGALRAMALADHGERRSGRVSPLARLLSPLTGG